MTSNSFLVGVYTDEQPFSIELNSSLVEDVCKECALRLEIDVSLIQLFSLFHDKRKIWLSPNHLLTVSDCKKDIEYMFRIRFHPEIPIKNDKFIRYLRLQYRHCFTKEFNVNTMETSNLFGLGVFDMLIDSYEKGLTSRRNVFQIRKYKNFFPQEKLKTYNLIMQWILIYNLRKCLLQKHLEYNGNYRIQGMGNTYVDKIRNEFYSQITKETYTYKDRAGNERLVTVEEKDSEFVVRFEEEIYCLKEVKSVKIRNNLVEIYISHCSPKMFQMEPDISESFVSAMDGLYRLAYNYHYGICDKLLSPKIKMLQTLGCYDHIKDEVAYDILKKADQKGCFLMRIRSNDSETFDVLALNTEDSRILKFTVSPNESLEDLQKTHSFLQQKLKPKHFEWCDLLYCHKTISPKESALEINNQVFMYSEISFLEEKPFDQGIFTETYLARIKDSKMPIVGIKTLKDFQGSYQYTQVFMEGISSMLELCKCSSFLQVKGIIMEPNLGLVTELPWKSVISYLSNNDQLPLKYILEMALTVAEGLEFLRKQDIVHGDISCENLQMIDVKTVKITDASIVNKVYLLPKNNVIYRSRLPWLDPLLRNILTVPTFESDIFSYGTLLCQMLCLHCKPPKQKQTINQAPCRLLFNISDDEEKAENARIVGKQLHDIILQCRLFKMEDRPQPQDITAKLIGLIHEPSMQERLPMKSSNDGLCDHNWNCPPFLPRDIPDAIKLIQEHTRKLRVPKSVPAYEIEEKNLVIKKRIGMGAFGKVYIATYSAPTQKIEVALKENIAGLNKSEIEIMYKLENERVVNFIGICREKWIVMEYVAGGDLHTKLNRSKTLIPNLKNILLGITEGMTYLAIKGVIHRDLAARNILLTENNDVKITDFGLSTIAENYKIKTARQLPIHWCAPEQLTNITSKSDVWSFGVVMWECYSLGVRPCLCAAKTFEKLLEIWEAGKRLNKPDKCPSVMYQIMQDCWKYEPNERPDFPSLRRRILDEA